MLQERRRQRRRKPGSGRVNGFIHGEGGGEGEEGEGGSASAEVGGVLDNLLMGCSSNPTACYLAACAASVTLTAVSVALLG